MPNSETAGPSSVLKSEPAMKVQRPSRVLKGGGGSGDLPRENFIYFRTSVETILMHFETIFET